MSYRISYQLLFISLVNAGWFESNAIGKPFYAEQHSTLTKLELGFNRSYAEYDILQEKTTFERPMVEAHLGAEIPIYAYTKDRFVAMIAWPVSMHVLEDMFGPVTAPVINTDYRFGGLRFSIAKPLPWNYLRNISITWLPIFHECTHLGDEITIARMEQNIPITRINVSYEYTELQLTLNDKDPFQGNSSSSLHSLRLGMRYRLSDRGYGWYSVREDAELTQPVTIQPSEIRGEYYLQYEWERQGGFAASPQARNLMSFEIRSSLRYGYPFYRLKDSVWVATEVKERRQWDMNFYWGWLFSSTKNLSPQVGIFFHAFRGVNPYGQLRNYPSYPFFGVAVTYQP